MPTTEQKAVIENLQLGLRVVEDNGTVLSGSLYFLFPVGADWDARLKGTAEIVKAASKPGKALYLLQGCGSCAVSADSFDGKSFPYGRIAGGGISIMDRANLYGNETVESLMAWVLRGVTKGIPREVVAVSIADTPIPAQPSAFATCVNTLAYIFSCCKPGYAQVTEDELDLT